MTLKTSSRVAMALLSGAVGGFGMHLLANHRIEKRGGTDMLAPYEFGPHYLIDAAGGIACAGLSYCVSGAWNWYQAQRQEQVDFAEAQERLAGPEAPRQQDFKGYTAVSSVPPRPVPSPSPSPVSSSV